jgi:hypothetical protein
MVPISNTRAITAVVTIVQDCFEFDRDNLGNLTAWRINGSIGTLMLWQTSPFDELGRLLTSVGTQLRLGLTRRQSLLISRSIEQPQINRALGSESRSRLTDDVEARRHLSSSSCNVEKVHELYSTERANCNIVANCLLRRMPFLLDLTDWGST